jgi:hypothetical protein
MEPPLEAGVVDRSSILDRRVRRGRVGRAKEVNGIDLVELRRQPSIHLQRRHSAVWDAHEAAAAKLLPARVFLALFSDLGGQLIHSRDIFHI